MYVTPRDIVLLPFDTPFLTMRGLKRGNIGLTCGYGVSLISQSSNNVYSLCFINTWHTTFGLVCIKTIT